MNAKQLTCPYCKKKQIKRIHIPLSPRGWKYIPPPSYIRRCSKCKRQFKIIVKNGKVIKSQRIKKAIASREGL